jgi:PEP-CTERM motif
MADMSKFANKFRTALFVVAVLGLTGSSARSITQNSTKFNDEFLPITPVTATSSLTFFFVAANQTSANGGTIGSAGTFRIGDFNPTGTPTPFTIDGNITPVSAVPEPSTLMLATIGLSVVGLTGRLRKRAGR